MISSLLSELWDWLSRHRWVRWTAAGLLIAGILTIGDWGSGVTWGTAGFVLAVYIADELLLRRDDKQT